MVYGLEAVAAPKKLIHHVLRLSCQVRRGMTSGYRVNNYLGDTGTGDQHPLPTAYKCLLCQDSGYHDCP
jgi:hypothetical protein